MVKQTVITGFCLLLLGACGPTTPQPGDNAATEVATATDSTPEPTQTPNINYDDLAQKIIYGQAKLHDVYQALTDRDTGRLTNVMHGLYSMHWHRGVYKLLFELWESKKQLHPEFAWDLIEKAPVRIALASTLTRIQVADNKEYLDYIRDHMYDEHEFHQAQVVVALGMNGDPEDVPYIKSLADGNRHYVIQSAITSLGLMNNPQASNALVELYKKHKNDPRGQLILEVLERAYHLAPQSVSSNQ